ncbi:diadenylate cyclase CdaA [bacterium]|nr:diadenylate cyclase CdaA [bacterium]
MLFRISFFPITYLDIIDIILLSLATYGVLKLIRQTKAIQIFLGVIILFAVGFGLSWLPLTGVNWLSKSLTRYWVILLFIIFQQELRDLFAQIGNLPFLRRIVLSGYEPTIETLVRAAEQLSETRTGALIVIERDVGLKNYTETGKSVSAKLSVPLLLTIFTPRTPLHDGAVIIKGNRITAAGCALPLSNNPRYQRVLGMRHRAGVGITEETDAVSIIVSEETGSISLAVRGHLRRGLSPNMLSKLLKVIIGSSSRRG